MQVGPVLPAVCGSPGLEVAGWEVGASSKLQLEGGPGGASHRKPSLMPVLPRQARPPSCCVPDVACLGPSGLLGEASDCGLAVPGRAWPGLSTCSQHSGGCGGGRPPSRKALAVCPEGLSEDEVLRSSGVGPAMGCAGRPQAQARRLRARLRSLRHLPGVARDRAGLVVTRPPGCFLT